MCEESLCLLRCHVLTKVTWSIVYRSWVHDFISWYRSRILKTSQQWKWQYVQHFLTRWTVNTGWWEIDIHGCYSLVKIAFAPIGAGKNNRRIWRHNVSTSRSRDDTISSDDVTMLSQTFLIPQSHRTATSLRSAKSSRSPLIAAGSLWDLTERRGSTADRSEVSKIAEVAAKFWSCSQQAQWGLRGNRSP